MDTIPFGLFLNKLHLFKSFIYPTECTTRLKFTLKFTAHTHTHTHTHTHQ